MLSEGLVSNPIEILANAVNMEIAAVKVIITILLGYPLAAVYAGLVEKRTATLKHLYFIICGLILGVWNFGFAFFHCMFATFFTYLTMLLLGGSNYCVAITFVFNMGYLLIAYVYSATEHYDINFTVPQCVLTLKLIGLAYDLYDGQIPEKELSEENKKVALKQKPELMEMFGYILFPAGFLIGPQFSLKRYQQFVASEFSTKPEDCDNSTQWLPALKRFALGFMYAAIYQTIAHFINDEYILSEDFATQGFLKKCLLLGLWGRYTLYKYMSVWLLAEGACIAFGLTYNGKDDKGIKRWDGLANVDLVRLETATEFNHYIQSFNINTNHWVAQYIYKRLKFVGNRLVSQIVALLFLALWHGFHTGYYVCFMFEFLVIYMERDVKSILSRNGDINRFLSRPGISVVVYVLLRLYTFVFMGWCLLPFVFLTFGKYWKAFGAVNYIGILLFGVYPFVYSALLRMLIRKKRED